MANKRCPYCGSLNTEVSLGNYATRGIINAAEEQLQWVQDL